MSEIIDQDLPTEVFDVFRVAQITRGTPLEHAVAVDPRLSARAEALRAAHGDLFQEILRLSELADELWREQRICQRRGSLNNQ